MSLHYHTDIEVVNALQTLWVVKESGEELARGVSPNEDKARQAAREYLSRTVRLAEECGHTNIKSTVWIDRTQS